jgi:DNA-binding NarL/FixJ family response regulator
MPNKVLIVDDSEMARKTNRLWIEHFFPELEIIEASTGEEAVSLAAREMPRIVSMDIRLPKMNGLAATRQIKKFSPETKVIIYTMYNGFQDDASEAGADAYVLKFCRYTELRQILQKMISPEDRSN